ncbi:surface protease GP63 [Trypanosoma cruzi]|nr:surface protease GP63 [Trypanosoma cruzi]
MAPIGCAGCRTELTLAAPADLGCMRVKWEMAELMRWWRNSCCALLQRKRSALIMSEYPQMFCEGGVPARRCTLDRYSSGWCADELSMRGQKTPDGQLPHHWSRTGCEKCCRCYLEGRIFVCGAWGQALFVVSGHASHQHDRCEGPGRNIHLGSVMHAALRCLGMRVRLRVTEEGNARCVPCTAEATITWVAPPYDEGKAIFRDHAQLCTISATSGSLLPVVSWGGDVREGVWSRTVSLASTEQALLRASVPDPESIGTDRVTPPKYVDTAAPQKHPSPEEKEVASGATTATECSCPATPRVRRRRRRRRAMFRTSTMWPPMV